MSAASREVRIDQGLDPRTLALADAWRRAVARSNYVPLDATELRAAFGSLTRDLLSGLLSDVDPAQCGRDVGTALVRIGYTSAEALGATMAIVAGELLTSASEHDGRVVVLLSGVATGFMAASRARLLDDQEATRRAVLEENQRAGAAIKRQAALLDLAPDAILVRGLDGRVAFWNPGAEVLYGWSREEAVGSIVHELLQTEFPIARDVIESSVLSAGRWEGELVHTRRDGAVISVSSRWACQLDEHGQPQAFLEINTDITARKQMEVMLREREASLETAQAIAHLGSWEFNPRTGETHWSAEAFRLLGYTEDEVQPSLDAYLRVVHPDDVPQVRGAVQDAIEGRAYPFEFRTTPRDGAARVLVSQSEAVMDESGVPRMLFGTLLDITERKRAESARIQLLAEQAARAEAEASRNRVAFLASASARLAASLDYQQTLRTVAELTIPMLADACTVDTVDDAGARTRVAEASAEGVESAELARFWSPETACEALSALVRAGDAAVCRNIAELGDHVDAASLAGLSAIGVQSVIIAPLLARGRVLGAITCFAVGSRAAYSDVERALVEDVAQRSGLSLDNARLHAEAQLATSLRDEFLSVAAHELKTPMTTLRGYTQLLGKSTRTGRVPPVELLDRSVKSIETQSEKLMKLTEQLLDVSRLETGKLPINPVRVELVDLIRGIVQTVQQSTDRHSIEVRSPETCVIEADPVRLEQVLANLIDNAVKYSPDGGQVEVALTEIDADTVELGVRDWGLGIPADRRENLFDRFYQAHSEGHYGGLGLGLFVSRQIVELHAGTIHAEFPTDRGSLFVVRLPRSTQPRA